ncbi:MAG: hypothetical protein ABSB29_03345 [Nitrososphaerales archaeon]|jgi:hypothetical protein
MIRSLVASATHDQREPSDGQARKKASDPTAWANPTVSILTIGLVALAAVAAPSLFSILAFLAAVFCVGARLVGLSVHDSLLQVAVGMQVGLAILVLVILVPFGTMMSFPIDFTVALLVSVSVSTLLIDVVYIIKGEPQKNDLLHYVSILRKVPNSRTLLIIVLFCAALLLRVAYQMGNTSTILPDGALNFAAARSLATTGHYSANVLSDTPIVSPLSPTVGLLPEAGTWFILSVFFSSGGVSFSVDLLMLLTLGMLLLASVYTIGRLWLGSRAWVPTLLASCLPVFLFFSSVPYGPEITSTVFAISGICVLETFRLRVGRIPLSGLMLAGLLFSISGLSWDMNATLICVLAYGILLLLFGPASKVGHLSFLLMGGVFAISVLYSEHWILNPWFFPLSILALAVGWSWKRWEPNLTVVLVWMSFTFALWLERFYLLPQYIIEPSQAYARTTESVFLNLGLSMSSLGSNVALCLDSARRIGLTVLSSGLSIQPLPSLPPLSSLSSNVALYLHLLQLGATYPLILLSVASVFFLYWIDVKLVSYAYVFLLLYAASAIVLLSFSSGFFDDFSATRFLVSSYVMLILLSSVTIIRVAEHTGSRVKAALPSNRTFIIPLLNTNRLHLSFKIRGNQVWAILVVFLLAAGGTPLAYGYVTGYSKSVSALHSEDYPQFLGVLSTQDWIQQNVAPGTVFQIASGQSARVWSMEIADMTFAGLNVVRYNLVVPFSEIGIGDVIQAAHSVNASYIILDLDVSSLEISKLLPYYDGIGPSDVGTMFPIFPSTSDVSSILRSGNVTALRLVYANGQTPDEVLIYEIQTVKLAPVWTSDFSSSGSWQVYLNGTITGSPTQMRLSTPPSDTQGKVYAEHVFNQELPLQNRTFLVYRTTSQDVGTLAGFYMSFNSGKSTIYTSATPGTYGVDLSGYAGSSPASIFLYNILESPKIAGTNSSYEVTYNWVALVTLLPS